MGARRGRAVLVFAEHGYYGESKPKPKEDEEDRSALGASNLGGIIPGHLKKKGEYPYLIEQTMADYALIHELKAEIRAPDAVFAAGGSYGGMLATWMRLAPTSWTARWPPAPYGPSWARTHPSTRSLRGRGHDGRHRRGRVAPRALPASEQPLRYSPVETNLESIKAPMTLRRHPAGLPRT